MGPAPKGIFSFRGSRSYGGYLVFTGIAVGFLSWWMPGLLAQLTLGGETPLIVSLLAAAAGWLPLLGLPAIFCGLMVVFDVGPRRLWVALGMLSLLVPALLLIYAAVVQIGALYQPEPL